MTAYLPNEVTRMQQLVRFPQDSVSSTPTPRLYSRCHALGQSWKSPATSPLTMSEYMTSSGKSFSRTCQEFPSTSVFQGASGLPVALQLSGRARDACNVAEFIAVPLLFRPHSSGWKRAQASIVSQASASFCFALQNHQLVLLTIKKQLVYSPPLSRVQLPDQGVVPLSLVDSTTTKY